MNIEDYKYKIELHAHTWPCSGCSSVTPERMAHIYKDLGYDAVVITNHMQAVKYHISKFANEEDMLNKYKADFLAAKAEGDKIGITVILGAEVNLAENRNDYLVYGVDDDFLIKASENLDKPLSEFYKIVKNDRNIILQAHPFRPNMVRMPNEYIDGMETFNVNPGHNSCVGLAAQYAMENNIKITVCGSDFHNEPSYGLGALCTKTRVKDSFELAAILKSRDYLFDISGNIVIPSGFEEQK